MASCAETMAFLKLAEETLRFEYLTGAVTPVRFPHGVGWRQLPALITAHITYETIVRLRGHANSRVRPGETLCLAPGLAHQLEVTREANGISRWSHVNFTILGSVDLFTFLEPPLTFQGLSASRIGDVNESLAELNAVPLGTLQQLVKKKALGFRLLELIADGSKVRAGGGVVLKGIQRLAPVLDHINLNLEKGLGREDLARLIHLSPSRFYAVFLETMGCSPRTYLQRQRLQRAQQILLRSDAPIKEVAAQSGHADPFHFSRLFKQQAGLSPLHYRIRARKGLIQ